MLNNSALASLHPGLLGLLCPSSWAVTMADAAATRPVERDAASSHPVIPSEAANTTNVPSITKCRIPWTQSSASNGVPDSLGGRGVFDSPMTTSRIGPTPQMKTTPMRVYAPPRRFPEIARAGLIRPRRWTGQGSGASSASLIQVGVLGPRLSNFRSHNHHAIGV